MTNYRLPLCPCGSGRVYEKCCYLKKGADGKPLFFKGALTSKDGVIWHPIPNARIPAIIVGQSIDKYREYAKELLTRSVLAKKNHEVFINNYGVFYQSHEQLLKTIETPSGEGVTFQLDTIEARKYWKDFLIHGRILLDFLGLHSREVLRLKQDIGGLDKKTFESILTILNKLGNEDKIFLKIKAELEPLRNDIIIFINFRNKEKTSGNTIVDFPAIDDEHGLVKDGIVSINGESFDMIKFINKSYESICKLTLIMLGIGQ